MSDAATVPFPSRGEPDNEPRSCKMPGCKSPLGTDDRRVLYCESCRSPHRSSPARDLSAADLAGREALSPAEACAALGISRPFLYTLLEGEDPPPSFKVGRKRLLPVHELRSWMRHRAEAQAVEDAENLGAKEASQ